MSYRLQFVSKALKEFQKLDDGIKEQFKKKLKERLENPHVRKDRLHGFKNVYKIKLRTAGYRLAYQVNDDEIVILVLAVGLRDKSKIYKLLETRYSEEE